MKFMTTELFYYLIFILLLVLCTSNVCESQNCPNPPKIITVSQSGKNANFKSIRSAVQSVPQGNSQWIHIKISPGVYRERVAIPRNKSCIYLEGSDSKFTRVEWSGHMNATFYSKANYTIAKGITFVNTLNNPVILEGSGILQAAAAHINGDKCAFINCAFFGVQDTLYDSYGRHYYHNCYIQGGIDFIYGNGQSIFEACTINFSMGESGPKIDGVITAHFRDSPNDTSGFVFKNCQITGNGGNKVELGRAMGAYARVIIANSYLTNVVSPSGWSARTYVGHEANFTFVEEGCIGAGADKTKRVPWMKHLSGHSLLQFLDISYIDNEGWIAKLPTNI